MKGLCPKGTALFVSHQNTLYISFITIYCCPIKVGNDILRMLNRRIYAVEHFIFTR